MNNKGRINLLKRIAEEQEMTKIAQTVVDSVQTENVDGEKIANDIFDKIIDGLTIEELERDAG